jgi:hypothetical protein
MKVLPATRIYENVKVRTLELEGDKKLRTEIKEARAQRLHAIIVHVIGLYCHFNSEHFCLPGE